MKGEPGIAGMKGERGALGMKGERGIVGNSGRKGGQGEKGENAKASQASVVPQTNWKQCVWKSETNTDNGKIRVIRIRIILNTIQRKFNHFKSKYFKEERLPCHPPFANSLHFLLLWFFSNEKRKTIVSDKMIPGHMDKDYKN